MHVILRYKNKHVWFFTLVSGLTIWNTSSYRLHVVGVMVMALKKACFNNKLGSRSMVSQNGIT